MTTTETIPITTAMVARAIDHTLLALPLLPTRQAAIEALCKEALAHGFAAVCIRPADVALARQFVSAVSVSGSPVAIASVIGFPEQKVTLAEARQRACIGAAAAGDKCREIEAALNAGAQELDVVLDVALFLRELAAEGDMPGTVQSLRAMRDAAGTRPIKLIVETDLLTPEALTRAIRVCLDTGMDTIKTSTGMISDGIGATPALIAGIRETVQAAGGAGLSIKASGGIRTATQAVDLIRAGANRLGTSTGVAIMSALQAQAPD